MLSNTKLQQKIPLAEKKSIHIPVFIHTHFGTQVALYSLCTNESWLDFNKLGNMVYWNFRFCSLILLYSYMFVCVRVLPGVATCSTTEKLNNENIEKLNCIRSVKIYWHNQWNVTLCNRGEDAVNLSLPRFGYRSNLESSDVEQTIYLQLCG